MTQPGWYPDPQDISSLRWWDGENWTENVKPAPSKTLPPSPFKASFPVTPGITENNSSTERQYKLPPRLPQRTEDGQISPFPERKEFPSLQFPQAPSNQRPSLPPRLSLNAEPASFVPRDPIEQEEIHAEQSPSVSIYNSARDVGLGVGFSPEEFLGDDETPAAPISFGEAVEERQNGYTHGQQSVYDIQETYNVPVQVSNSPERRSESLPAEAAVKKFWTRTTIMISSISLLLTLAVPFGVLTFRESQLHRADNVANSFLASIQSGDKEWSKYITPDTFDSEYPPFAGNEEAAVLADLKVSVMRDGKTLYNDPCGLGNLSFDPTGCSDKAQVNLIVNYSLGDKHSSENEFVMNLSRPFYYGDEEPQEAQKGKNPSKIGEWSISNFQLRFGVAQPLYVLPETGNPNDDSIICSSIDDIFVDLSTTARIEEVLSSRCTVDEGFRKLGEEVSVEQLVSEFPIYNEATILSLENKTGVSTSQIEEAPYLQYELVAGEGIYVLSFVLTEESGSNTYRLLSIVKKTNSEIAEETLSEE